MRNATIALLLATLLGCYAQVEDGSISITHTLCTPRNSNCIPGAGPLAIIQVNGENTFTANFGDQPLLKPSTSLGPTTLTTVLILNQATITMITQGVDLSGIQSATLYAVHPGVCTGTTCATIDPCATTSNCTVVATYTQPNPPPAQVPEVVLKGSAKDLVPLIDQATHSLTMEIAISGSAPSNPWNADVAMDMSLKSRASFP